MFRRDLEMAKVFSLANQKGGVGKTTTTINLAAGAALSGKWVLVVDFDPQGNASSGLGIDRDKRSPGVYEAIIGKVPVSETVRETQIPRLSVIPSTRDLIGAEIELIDVEDRTSYLKNILAGLKKDFDFIFIDCPPSLGLLTLNAMAASDSVLVTLQAEYYAMEGLSQLIETVDMVAQRYNEGLVIGGICFTMMDRRTNLCRQVEQDVRDHFKDLVFQTTIPRNVRLSEAPSFGRTIFQHDARSSGATAYLNLARELTKREAAASDAAVAPMEAART